ncbi:MAG: hypothetical protein V4710_04210 [Verrucomicrobiota bacterium]
MRFHSRPQSRSGFTITEVMVSALIGGFVLGALVIGSITIQRSFYATNRYAAQINNESRLMDYVAQDLRRALRVGVISSGTYTKLPAVISDSASTPVGISETNVLAINIPDYYASNSPNNTKGSNFKISRYARSLLDSSSTYNSNPTETQVLNGSVPWSEAVVPGTNPTLRYAPASAGNGEIQVRYYRAVRSTRDNTLCYFRAEYPAGSNTPTLTREIAERIVDASTPISLLITSLSKGTRFQLRSEFLPRHRLSNKTTAGTEQYVVVTLRNKRKDLP